MKLLASFCVSITELFLMASISFGGEITIKTSGSGIVDAVLTYTIENKEVTITGCNKDVAGDLVIPETIEGLPVVKTNNCFDGFHPHPKLTSITLPETFDRIGNWNFAFTQIYLIHFPKSLKIIENNAFRQSRLQEITIPQEVTKIGQFAFLQCGGLKSVTFEGPAPETSGEAFFQKVHLGSQREVHAIVQRKYAASFGGEGADWKGLIVTIAKETQEDSKGDAIVVETPEFNMPDLVDLEETGNDYLDKLLAETRAKWVSQIGEAVGEIDRKFVETLESTKRNLVKEDKIAEARAYDNAIKGGEKSAGEPASLVKLREARADVISKTINPINRKYWERLKEIREAFQEGGNLAGVVIVDEEIQRLIENYSKAPQKVSGQIEVAVSEGEDEISGAKIFDLEGKWKYKNGTRDFVTREFKGKYLIDEGGSPHRWTRLGNTVTVDWGGGDLEKLIVSEENYDVLKGVRNGRESVYERIKE